MTLTLRDLKHLEIMAELEARPIPSPELASLLTEEKEPTLTEQLLTLASKLRVAGFIVQAENLETCLGLYKKAEVDANLLYRAHSETGDDLLEFAHPDGDVEMAVAGDHLGDVETLPSQHKKILLVVEKTAQTMEMIKNVIIAQKFQALVDFISKNYFSADPDELQKNKKLADFVSYATKIHDLAQKIVQMFNNAEESPKQAAYSRLNQALNSPSFKIESVEDIDSYIEMTIKTLEAGSPLKKAAVIDMLRKSLRVEALLLLPIEIFLIKRLNDYFSRTTRNLNSAINSVNDDLAIVSKSPLLEARDLKFFGLFKVDLKNLELYIKELKVDSHIVSQLEVYKNQLNEYATKIGACDAKLTFFLNQEQKSSGLLGRAWNATLGQSIFQDAKNSLFGLTKALNEVIGTIGEAATKLQADLEIAKQEPKNPQEPDKQPITAIPEEGNSIVAEIGKLESWRSALVSPNSKIKPENQRVPLDWINKQIRDMSSLSLGDKVAINKHIEENKQFEKDWASKF